MPIPNYTPRVIILNIISLSKLLYKSPEFTWPLTEYNPLKLLFRISMIAIIALRL